MRKRRRLSFNPEPEIHEFDFRSPTKCRIRAKLHKDAVELDDDDLELELALATNSGRIKHTPKRKATKAATVDKVWCQDLTDELNSLGFEVTGPANRLALAKRVQLANSLVKRAELLGSGMPLALKTISQSSLEHELLSRKIQIDGCSRRQMIKMLSVAMIKEDTEGLKGDGYEFGRRFVSIDDYLYPMSDADLRHELKTKFNMATTPRKKVDKQELLTHKLNEMMQMNTDEDLLETIREELHRRNLDCEGDRQTLFDRLFIDVDSKSTGDAAEFDIESFDKPQPSATKGKSPWKRSPSVHSSFEECEGDQEQQSFCVIS